MVLGMLYKLNNCEFLPFPLSPEGPMAQWERNKLTARGSHVHVKYQESTVRDATGQYLVTHSERGNGCVRFQSRENCRSCTEILHALFRALGSSPALSLATQVHWGNASLYLLHRCTEAMHSVTSSTFKVLLKARDRPWRHRWIDSSSDLQKLTEKPAHRGTCLQTGNGK